MPASRRVRRVSSHELFLHLVTRSTAVSGQKVVVWPCWERGCTRLVRPARHVDDCGFGSKAVDRLRRGTGRTFLDASSLPRSGKAPGPTGDGYRCSAVSLPRESVFRHWGWAGWAAVLDRCGSHQAGNCSGRAPHSERSLAIGSRGEPMAVQNRGDSFLEGTQTCQANSIPSSVPATSCS